VSFGSLASNVSSMEHTSISKLKKRRKSIPSFDFWKRLLVAVTNALAPKPLASNEASWCSYERRAVELYLGCTKARPMVLYLVMNKAIASAKSLHGISSLPWRTCRDGSGQAHSTVKMPVHKEANTSIRLLIYTNTPI
jgi:hypothetical protein